MKNNNYMCHLPNLRSSTVYDHDFWYTCVKWWISPGVFSFFWNFHFFDCYGCKAKNSPKLKITITSHMPYLRNSKAYDYDFWYTCVKWWYLQGFFSVFLKFSFFGCYGGKSAKNSSKWKITITSATCHMPGKV